jgi:hypothetical protein
MMEMATDPRLRRRISKHRKPGRNAWAFLCRWRWAYRIPPTADLSVGSRLPPWRDEVAAKLERKE